MQVTKMIETAATFKSKQFDEDLRKLQSGCCVSVDGFDFYFFSSWTPSLRTVPRKDKKSGNKNKQKKQYKPKEPIAIFDLEDLDEILANDIYNYQRDIMNDVSRSLKPEIRRQRIARTFQRSLDWYKETPKKDYDKVTALDRGKCLRDIFSREHLDTVLEFDYVKFVCDHLDSRFSYEYYPPSEDMFLEDYIVTLTVAYENEVIELFEIHQTLETALNTAAYEMIEALNFKFYSFRELLKRFAPLLLCGDVELNPGPEHNGNTKRDSKRHGKKVDPVERLEKLSQRTDQIGVEAKFDKKKLVKSKRQNAAHKQVMKTLFPKKQALFSVNHNIRLEVFTQIKEIIDSLPHEMRQILDWAGVLASVHVLLNQADSYSAKYIAIRELYSQFNVKGIDLDTIVTMIIGVLLSYGLTFKDLPSKQSMDHELDPVSTLITILLTFMFGRKPHEGFLRNFTANLGSLPRATDGVHSLIQLVKRMCGLLTGSNIGESTYERIVRLHKSSMEWTSREGLDSILLDESGFDKVCKAYTEAEELAMVLKPRTAEYSAFIPTLLRIRQFYRQVMISPASGHTYRVQPVVLQLVGDPGVGKTLMINALAADALHKIFELQNFSREERKEKLAEYTKYVYYRPFGHKYETNYNSRLSQIYVIDDANQVSPDYCHDDVPIPAKIINYANNAELLMPVAEIENKRSAFFNSKLIIMTDNMEDPCLKYLAEPEAYRRRLDLRFRVKLNDSHKKMGPSGVRIADPSKFSSTHFDTSAYLFEVIKGNNEIYTYDQVVRLLWEQLCQKHMEFIQHRRNFVQHALRHLDESDIGNTSVSDVSPSVSNVVSDIEAISPTTNKTCINENASTLDASLVNTFMSSDAEAASPLMAFPQKQALFGETKQVIQTGKLMSYSLYERFTTFVSLIYLRGKIKWYQQPSFKDRLKLFSCIGLLVGAIGTAWFILTKSKSNKSSRRGIFENYSSGTANAVPKGKPRGKAKIRIVKKQSDETERVCETLNAEAFTNDLLNQSVADPDGLALQRKLVANMYRITICCPVTGNEKTQNGFFIKGKIFVINAHLISDYRKHWNKCTIHLDGVRGQYAMIPCEDVSVYDMEQDMINGEVEEPYDVCFLEFPKFVHSHTDITSYFCTVADQNTLMKKKCILISVFNPSTTWEVTKQHTYISAIHDDWIPSLNGSEQVLNLGVFEYPGQTLNGSCGSVVLLNDKSSPRKIVGIHFAAYDNHDVCFGSFLPAEYVKELCKGISFESSYSLSGERVCQSFDKKTTVVDDALQHVTCIPHFIHSSMETKIRKSLIHGQVSQPVKAPARLGYVDENGLKVHVVNKALKKYVGSNISVSETHQQVFKSFLKVQFLSGSPVKELSREIAIRGIEGDDFLRAINRSSSPGYPFVKHRESGKLGKTTFLGEDENFIFDHPFVLEEIKNYETSVRRGIRPICVFTSTAKDELRTLEKVKEGKTRSFAAAPLHFTILFRQKFLDLFANVMRERIDNSSLVGVNCYGEDWDYLATRLCQISKPNKRCFLAGDFSNFDGTLSRALLWNMFESIEHKYGRNNDKLTYALWTDITDSLQVFGNTVIEVTRGQPSGNPGTTIINSFYNSALLYTVIWELCTRAKAFEIRSCLSKHFRAFVYGDDNIMVFSQDLADIIDPRNITKCMKEFGMVYTSDDKTDAELCYRTLFEISILKRRFVWDKDNRKWLSPLELPSILEPLNWDKVDDTQIELKKEQMSINAKTAIRELSYHDAQTFDKYQTRILKACEAADIILDPYCYFNHKTARKTLINEQLLISNDLTVNEVDNKTFRRSFYSERRPGQSLGIDSSNMGEDRYDLIHCQCTTTTTNQNTSENILGAQSQEAEHTGDVPFLDATAPTTTGNEIVAFSTVESPMLETVPMPADLPEQTIGNVLEGREHTILDVLCREYAFEDFEIPIGGLPGQILKTWDMFEIFLAQPNVFDKVSGFAFLRTDLVLRLEFTTLPTVVGGVMLSYFPDINLQQLASRTQSLLQLSQVPNLQQSLTTAVSMKMHVPWISPVFARDLLSGQGGVGTVILSRLTPSSGNRVNVKAYISADKESLKLQYPVNSIPKVPASFLRERILQYVTKYNESDSKTTFVLKENELPVKQSKGKPKQSGAPATESTQMQKKGTISGLLSTTSKLAMVASAIPGIGEAAAVAAPLLKLGSSLAGAFGLSKPVSDKPVRAIKWKPASDALTSEGVLDCHEFTINKSVGVDAQERPFGSEIDEMTVEAIMKVPNIISTFNVSIAMPSRFVVYKRSLNLIQLNPFGVTSGAYLTHQAWLTTLFKQWIANLNFDFDCYMTHFHRVKLRFIVLPGVYDTPAVGTLLPASFDINKVSSAVVEFSGDNINWSIRIEPRLMTAMKLTTYRIPIPAAGLTLMDDYIDSTNNISSSYGTLLVAIEVPLQASATVANNIDFVVSFSADDAKLACPHLAPVFLPTLQSNESTLGTAYAKMSRSERMVRGSDMLTSNSVPQTSTTALGISVGDHFLHLRNLMNSYMTTTLPIGMARAGTTGTLFYRPTFFRYYNTGPLEINTNIDYLDYFSKGFAFFKGGINVRLVPFGNLIPQNIGYLIMGYEGYNQLGMSDVLPNNSRGYLLMNGRELNRCIRCIPVHSSEASIDATIPYYQPLHMRRAFQDPVFNSSTPDEPFVREPFLMFIAKTDLELQVYRAAADDFRMGFLFSLPPFVLLNSSAVTVLTPP